MTQAASGYAIGALLKHVDAIGQVFADVVAMLFSALVAFALFDLAANWQYAVALLVCSMSLGVSRRPRRNLLVRPPRTVRVVGAARLHGLSTLWPRRRRDSPPPKSRLRRYYLDVVRSALDAHRRKQAAVQAAVRDAQSAADRDGAAQGFWATRSPLVVADPRPGASVELTAARRLAGGEGSGVPRVTETC